MPPEKFELKLTIGNPIELEQSPTDEPKPNILQPTPKIEGFQMNGKMIVTFQEPL